ncbi:isoflavone 7-O-glucosyltransferase 1-like [Helianthus annuus]|uniref:isoflavone 7-O-glucosyltransferase 1-like n=1 Tax=Helianthus annuus TaxID=4232 RepID=UPI000B8F9B3C|nr:isoflavone 7-O-glucosyltransferase 1-like [Helianthus annuus]
METVMDVQGLWESVESPANAVLDEKKNKTARSFIFQAIPEDVLLQVAKKKTAKEIWKSLKTRYVGANRVQKARLHTVTVGGYVTHCGWNSVLEATCAGVPMIGWSLIVDQKLNKIMMVEEMELALPMDQSEDRKVTAAEVEKRVRQLMESEEGKVVREMAKARKVDAARALSEGGSSRVELKRLVESWQPTTTLIGI